jgi:magnesium-transporting ATPase (P-type)
MQKSKFGGVLSIIAGALGLIGALVMFYFSNHYPSMADVGEDPNFGMTMFNFLGVMVLIFGLLAIIGGITALQRKNWALALAGAIFGALACLPLGVPAVVLIAMGYPEFTAREADV